MNPAGPELRDIHLPPDPSWWPPAPGWWVLAVLIGVALVWLVLRLRRAQQARRLRRAVLGELERIAARHAEDADGAALLAAVSNLLRRASRWRDTAAVSLHGEAWLQFLDRGIGAPGFSQGAGRVLLEGPYRRHADVDAPALIKLCRDWLEGVLKEKPRG